MMEMPVPSSIILERKSSLVLKLQKILPKGSVIHDKYETKAYECDALTAYRCPPMCVVLPETTKQVSDVLKICYLENIPVVPRGSGTSLSGGALPTADCVVLGVSKLNKVLENLYSTNFFEDIKIKITNNILQITLKEYPVINQLVVIGEPSNKYIEEIKKIIKSKEKNSFIKNNI